MSDTDLVALAAAASANTAVTGRLELYPRDLSPERALKLSQVVSYLSAPLSPGTRQPGALARKGCRPRNCATGFSPASPI